MAGISPGTLAKQRRSFPLSAVPFGFVAFPAFSPRDIRRPERDDSQLDPFVKGQFDFLADIGGIGIVDKVGNPKIGLDGGIFSAAILQ